MPGLNLEQKQQLYLSPELQTGIGLMTLSLEELCAQLESSIAENPFLRFDEDALGRFEGSDFNHADGIASRRTGFESHSTERSDADGPDNLLANVADDNRCLESVLYHQLAMELHSATDLRIVERLLDGLDQGGFLRMDTAVIARELGVKEQRVERVLAKLQRDCVPAGIGARNLQERLLAQLEADGPVDPLTREVIGKYLESLAEGRFAQVAAALQTTQERIKEIFDAVRGLDPHPASSFERPQATIVPEVKVVRAEDGWEVVPQYELLPEIALDRETVEAVSSASLSRESAKELKKLLYQAKNLVRAVDLRKLSVIAVATWLVEVQRDYFERGPAGLIPLTMLDAAQACEISESTVSRIANSAYMDTPHGIVAIRYFFTSAVGGDLVNDGASSRAVKQKIQELVAAEDPRHPLSDSQLVELLLECGMRVSRRTVNKYRTTLGILSKSKRRSY